MNALRVPPQPDPSTISVRIEPMRRRHVRPILRIEQQVYPRPWTVGVFLSELRQRDTRCYVVARVGAELVGYGGELFAGGEAHVTNVAVDPSWQRHGIGTRVLSTLTRVAIARGAKNLTLEVRESNRAAQGLYRLFGLAPVGFRKRYYEQTEDAIVMWVHDIDTPSYAEQLASIESAVQGTTDLDAGLALREGRR